MILSMFQVKMLKYPNFFFLACKNTLTLILEYSYAEKIKKKYLFKWLPHKQTDTCVNYKRVYKKNWK